MTHEYRATVEWKRQDVAFVDNKYSRGHDWRFDGGVEVLASSAPASVPLPYSVDRVGMSALCQKQTFCTVVQNAIIRSPRRRGRDRFPLSNAW
jgi:hypothetical protein